MTREPAQESKKTEALCGYAHPAYVQSLGEFGAPSRLPKSSASILQRPIPGTKKLDAMGPYPIFACPDWNQLSADLNDLEGQLVSFSAVLDPFGGYDEACLRECFPDLTLPFKNHFVTDLSRSPAQFVSAHHRRNARKALRQISVEITENPSLCLEEWLHLYGNLIQRHAITDIRSFSRSAFSQQLAVPGMVAFRARHNQKTVGMLLWYAQNDVAYYHLGAYDAVGYESNASFALFWTAFEYFGNKNFRWLNLGAGAGTESDKDDGLTRFKRGWATDTRTAFFCGRILDRDAYTRLAESTGTLSTQYFPAYRKGEFCKKKPNHVTAPDQSEHDDGNRPSVDQRVAAVLSDTAALPCA